MQSIVLGFIVVRRDEQSIGWSLIMAKWCRNANVGQQKSEVRLHATGFRDLVSLGPEAPFRGS
jgi:hypothetical protein